jgi:hypothetical protein
VKNKLYYHRKAFGEDGNVDLKRRINYKEEERK